MKLYLRKTTTRTLLLVTLGLFAVFGLLVVFAISVGQAKASSFDGRLITVHDRGLQTSFLTKQETLREALASAHIEVDSRDAVEPSLDEKLVASDYQVNIYRARPVTVVDGITRQKIITPYQTPERIARDAGIELYPEDKASLELSSNILEGAGLEMRIVRAQLVSVDLYGKQTNLRTQAKTVSEFLKEKNILLGTDGRVQPSGTTKVQAGMALRVWREGKQTVTAEEPIKFETEHIKDADRPATYKEVKTPGKDGKRSVTYEIIIENGVEVRRTEIASVTTEEPVKQVEVIGAKPEHRPYTGGGTKTDWLAASLIPQDMWGYADFMVQKESGWNPNAMNKSSGACGLAQALPCSKLGPNWNDPVVALNWMNGYVNGRYGGWEQAYAFWQKNRWY